MRRSQGTSRLVQELRACLEQERTALVAGDLDRLGNERDAKSRLLGELAQVRVEFRGDNGAPAMPPPLRAELEQLARQNEDNARLLAARSTVNQARLEALLGAAQLGSAQMVTYGAAGTLQSSAAPRASASA